MIALIGYPQPTASPADAGASFTLPPQYAADVAMLAVIIAGCVITLIYMNWLERRAAKGATCICGHSRLDHRGFDERFECLRCRCRCYIRKPNDKDWRV